MPVNAIFSIDVLPGYCGIEGEGVRGDDDVLRIRFRASRRTRFLRRTRWSGWSGWFPYDGEPVRLTWRAFWTD